MERATAAVLAAPEEALPCVSRVEPLSGRAAADRFRRRRRGARQRGGAAGRPPVTAVHRGRVELGFG